MLLQHLEQAASRAHNHISFSPEVRGKQLVADYSQELQEDIDFLKSEGISEEVTNEYKARYERLLVSWLHAKSNTFSVMITGGGNFPVRRHEKANRSEQRHYELFRIWREKAKKAIVRKEKPVKTYVSELDRYKADLAQRLKNKELMKACNAILRKAKGSDCTEQLMKAGLSENLAKEVQVNVPGYGMGFPHFSLTNNNTTIRRIEDRIKLLEQKEKVRQVLSTEKAGNEFSFDGGVVVLNYEADRIQINYDSKPAPEVIAKLKKAAFKWSPSNGSWQRFITSNSVYAANSITGASAHKIN